MAEQITQAEWARRRGFSRQYVGRLVRRGLVRLVDGKLDPAEADAALAALREPARAERRKTGGALDQAPAPRRLRAVEAPAAPASGADLPTLLLRTRVKSEVERAKLLEIKAKVEAGKYVDADEVKVAAFNKARVVRESLLNLPDRLAAVLAAESDAQKVHALLATELRDALDELTNATSP